MRAEAMSLQKEVELAQQEKRRAKEEEEAQERYSRKLENQNVTVLSFLLQSARICLGHV